MTAQPRPERQVAPRTEYLGLIQHYRTCFATQLLDPSQAIRELDDLTGLVYGSEARDFSLDILGDVVAKYSRDPKLLKPSKRLTDLAKEPDVPHTQ